MESTTLRAGSWPSNNDSVLWFEFLLNPCSLKMHLEKAKPDPTPTDLIMKFMSISSDASAPVVEKPPPPTVDNLDDKPVETPKPNNTRSRKSLALKIMSLKIAAFLKWNLETIEQKLPLPMQITLLQDLLFVSREQKELSDSAQEKVNLQGCSAQELFAVLLYHRWVLRAVSGARMSAKQPRVNYFQIPVPPLLLDELLMNIESQVPQSIAILNQISSNPNLTLNVPIYETFEPLTEDSEDIQQQWETCIKASDKEVHCQIHFDLAAFYFSREQYKEARENIWKAFQIYKNLPKSKVYCIIEEETLKGYCKALGISCEEEHDLFVQFLTCKSNHFNGIVSILQKDNLTREIPINHRDVLELEIQAASSSGDFFVARDLLLQVHILNSVRRAVDGMPNTVNLAAKLRQSNSKGLEKFIAALKAVLSAADKQVKANLQMFLLDLIEAGVPNLDRAVLTLPELSSILSPEQNKHYTKKLKKTSHNLKPCWHGTKDAIRNVKLQKGMLEQKLILSSDPVEIKHLITLLNAGGPMKPPMKLNSKWELPIPVHSAVMALPRGILQDLTFILLAKSRELTLSEDYEGAHSLLKSVEKEVHLELNTLPGNLAFKLGRLVSWEVLLVSVLQFLNDWPVLPPAAEPVDLKTNANMELASHCKACLSSLQAGEQMIPRSEVLEHCALALLNLGEWDYLSNLDRRSLFFEMPGAFSFACLDITKHKGTKKVSRREAWDLILTVFGSGGLKRTSTGQPVSMRDSPGLAAVQSRAQFQQFLSRLREPTTISVAVSILARLYNVLKDEPTLELNVEYAALWPAVVSNANSFSSRMVGEVLSDLLQQALKYYPDNVSWLKVLGDINFANGFSASALKNYLQACITVSGFFSRPVPRFEIDDQVYKRMIKCCTQLQCHTQAAVLCQFLDDVDYATAFKSLQEKNCADAMDAYYNCIWDVTMLEFFVHLHYKRGEQDRRQQANKYLGLLELNGNNNDDIKREASSVRKACFLRTIAQQYVC
ncbi:integrator complex subunit 8 [Neocloeon triangulifer]|uniref:integrator complex subunit 8 n=1 Tax=Neocloeon triangulifer TaxID=2078957 RepID=UPI00286EC13B|nr:integrator complex subunit 8 [Neocloeon triangulifer]